MLLAGGGRLCRRRPFRFILPILLLLAAGCAVFEPALAAANGRATLIARQEQGPYGVEVSILPSRAVVNNTHLSVRVTDLRGGAELTAAMVLVSATGPADVAGQVAAFGPIPAVNDALPQFYEATLPFAVPGEWQLTLRIASELGTETIRVPLLVREGQPINLILVAAVAVAALAVGLWTYDRIRGRRRPAAAAG